jgi:hypothetical protein
MAQGSGLVNVVVKNKVGYFDDAGTYILGDGATADDVTPRTAADLAQADALVVTTDVKILATDFKTYVTPLEGKFRD